jgi:hypothetical protein
MFCLELIVVSQYFLLIIVYNLGGCWYCFFSVPHLQVLTISKSLTRELLPDVMITGTLHLPGFRTMEQVVTNPWCMILSLPQLLWSQLRIYKIMTKRCWWSSTASAEMIYFLLPGGRVVKKIFILQILLFLFSFVWLVYTRYTLLDRSRRPQHIYTSWKTEPCYLFSKYLNGHELKCNGVRICSNVVQRSKYCSLSGYSLPMSMVLFPSYLRHNNLFRSSGSLPNSLDDILPLIYIPLSSGFVIL